MKKLINPTYLLTLLLLLSGYTFAQQVEENISQQYDLRQNNSLEARYWYEEFDEVFGPRQMVEVEYARRENWGTVLGRFQHAHRFGIDDQSATVDFYPKLSDKSYGFIQYGYGFNSTLFPTHRIGLEYFRTLGKSEVSLGYRHLDFENMPVNIYTVGLSHYLPKYWLNARVFLTPNDSEVANTYLAQVRRYFGSQNEYAGILANYGSSFENVDLAEALQVRSFRVGLNGQKRIKGNWYAKGALEYRNEELAFDTDRTINRITFMVGLKYFF